MLNFYFIEFCYFDEKLLKVGDKMYLLMFPGRLNTPSGQEKGKYRWSSVNVTFYFLTYIILYYS